MHTQAQCLRTRAWLASRGASSARTVQPRAPPVSVGCTPTTLEKLPRVQARHASADTAPGCALEIPGLHGVHEVAIADPGYVLAGQDRGARYVSSPLQSEEYKAAEAAKAVSAAAAAGKGQTLDGDGVSTAPVSVFAYVPTPASVSEAKPAAPSQHVIALSMVWVISSKADMLKGFQYIPGGFGAALNIHFDIDNPTGVPSMSGPEISRGIYNIAEDTQLLHHIQHRMDLDVYSENIIITPGGGGGSCVGSVTASCTRTSTTRFRTTHTLVAAQGESHPTPGAVSQLYHAEFTTNPDSFLRARLRECFRAP